MTVKRMFIIKRLKNHVGTNSLKKLVDGLFSSKINYGLQLYGKVRVNNNDPKNGDIKAIYIHTNIHITLWSVQRYVHIPLIRPRYVHVFI